MNVCDAPDRDGDPCSRTTHGDDRLCPTCKQALVDDLRHAAVAPHNGDDTFVQWCIVLLDTDRAHGRRMRVPRLAHPATWLAARIDAIARHPDAGMAADDLRRACRATAKTGATP